MKKTICFLTCVLMAVLVPVTGMALVETLSILRHWKRWKTHLSSTGYQWYDPVETRETLENLYAYDAQESASETNLSAMFISRPMWGVVLSGMTSRHVFERMENLSPCRHGAL